MNRAAMIFAALSNLLGGLHSARKDARDQAYEERRLALQEAKLENDYPSSGVANLEYLKKSFPGQEVSREDALRLLSPAGFGISPDLAAYMRDPASYKGYVDTKARAGKATYDFGEESEDSDGSNRDEPSSPRPAIRVPVPPQKEPVKPVDSPASSSVPVSDSPKVASATKGPVRKRFNPKTGELEIVEKVNFNDLNTED